MPYLQINYLHSQAKVNDTIFFGVIADSEGQLIEGMDVMLDISPTLRITNYLPSQLLPVHNFETHNYNGIAFSQLCNPGEPLAVKGLIAVVECKAVSKGYANIRFKFTLGSTTDSNMAQNGVDILTKVINRRVTIT